MNIKFITIILNITNLLLINYNNHLNNTKYFILSDYYKIQKHTSKINNNSSKNITFLKKMDKLCNNITCEQQIMIELIDCYFKSNNIKLALNTIDQFLNLYPNHSKIDFILYTKGLINVRIDKNKNNILRLLNNNNLARYNPAHAYKALENFIDLTKKFPNSQYYEDSKKNILYLQNRIAEYNLCVAKFYYKKHAYIATINRINQILHDFPHTTAAYQALPYLQKSYKYLDNLKKINN